MSAKEKPIKKNWIDPDDAPELTPELAGRAQIAVGGKVIREATGTLTRRGRPPVGDEPKQQVTLRLPREVIAHFKADGRGWQTRIGDVLEQHVQSSVIRSFHYRASGRSLDIEFVTGRMYRYEEVPAEVVQSLRSAPSKARYFNAHVRDRYRYRELGAEESRRATRSSPKAANQNDVSWYMPADTVAADQSSR